MEIAILVTGIVFTIFGYILGTRAGFERYSAEIVNNTVNSLISRGFIKTVKLPDGQISIVKIKDPD